MRKLTLTLIAVLTIVLTACAGSPLFPGGGQPEAAAPQQPVDQTVAEQPEAAPAVSCPQARDLGPWAPSASGEGQTFEVTASDQNASNLSSAGVVLGLWWPHGRTDWGMKEITTFVPRGLSITVIAASGRGWDYERTCSDAEVKQQMDQHVHDRPNDTAYYGFVQVETLIEKGLVEVRFDRRSR